MKVIEITRAQQMAAEALIRMNTRDGLPITDVMLRYAAAKARPVDAADLSSSADQVVVYVV